MARHNSGLSTDRLVGLLLLVASIGYGLASLPLRSLKAYDAIGPAGFPLLIAMVGTALSLVLVTAPGPDPQRVPGSRRAWACWGLFAVYTLLIPPLGFGIASLLFLVAILLALKVRLPVAVFYALLVTVALIGLFAYGLGLRLAIGFWS